MPCALIVQPDGNLLYDQIFSIHKYHFHFLTLVRPMWISYHVAGICSKPPDIGLSDARDLFGNDWKQIFACVQDVVLISIIQPCLIHAIQINFKILLTFIKLDVVNETLCDYLRVYVGTGTCFSQIHTEDSKFLFPNDLHYFFIDQPAWL